MTLKLKTILFSALALTILLASVVMFHKYRTANSRLYKTISLLEKVNHAGQAVTIEILLDLTSVDSLRTQLKELPLITRQLQKILTTADKPAELINVEMSFVRLKRVIDSIGPGQALEKPLLAQVRNEAGLISDNIVALRNLSEQEINKLQSRAEIMLTALFVMLVTYIVGMFFLLYGTVIKPLLTFSRQVEGVRGGHQENVALSPRKDELGQLAEEFNQLINMRRQTETELKEEILLHKQALEKVKLLSGFLPICASCKKIRDDRGYWKQIETYIRDNSEAEFTHSICPPCADKLYGDVHKMKPSQRQ